MHRPEMHQDCPRLWLVSGTGEGPELAAQLLQRGWQLTVSVVSPSAAQAYRSHPGLAIHVGALGDEAGVEAELARAAAAGRPYGVVVDASHPFARQVSHQLAAVCRRRGQRLLRLQRPIPEGPATLLPELKELRGLPLQGESLLLAIGARQLGQAVACSPGARHHARLLPRAHALQQAMAAGLSPERVACLRPGAGLAVEGALLRRWRIGTVLARQSGGATERLWRHLCSREGLRLILLARPPEPEGSELLAQGALLEVLDALLPPPGL
ncbi:precorrin-6A/cobalt-precorrin-6A reductase [Cyanobium sp. FACHB-13342]|nr:precorrin-6A/cobalt-precorrin-6A reductase [Cyanobium sp. FACHB-13342]